MGGSINYVCLILYCFEKKNSHKHTIRFCLKATLFPCLLHFVLFATPHFFSFLLCGFFSFAGHAFTTAVGASLQKEKKKIQNPNKVTNNSANCCHISENRCNKALF